MNTEEASLGFRSSRFCKSSISRHKTRKHRRDELPWIYDVLSGRVPKQFRIGQKIPMHGCRQFDRQFYRLVVLKRSEFQFGHGTDPAA